MNGVLDATLVGLALAASAAYVVAVLGPRAWRARLLAALASWCARAPAGSRRRRAAERIAAAAAKSQAACGGCGDCGASAGSRSAASNTRKKPADVVEFPVERIGRRGE